MFTLAELEAAADLVHRYLPPTPAREWPLLAERFGVPVVVKHENHAPTGAFKVRGGLVHLERLARERPGLPGIISATRGNHGQSLAYAGRTFAIPVTIVVPHGNSVEKNRAIRAFGARLIEHGRDFDEAREEAARLAASEGLEFVPSFQTDLVKGVATYALELFRAVPDLATVYAPIGLGSGICGLIMARDLMGLSIDIVGVVSSNANTYVLSVAAGRPVPTNSATTFADGMAVRIPSPAAVTMIAGGVARLIEVDDDEVAEAMRVYHEDTHNMSEGAGAAPLAGLAKDRSRRAGKAATVLSGGNIDRGWAAEVLAGRTPRVG